MKIAISTVCCMGGPPDETAETLGKHRIDGIEIRLDNNGAVFGAHTPEELAGVRRLFAQKHLQITNLGSSVCLTGYDAGQIKAAKAALDTCVYVGSPAVRIFLGNFCVRTNDPRTPLDREGILRALQEICAYGLEKHLEIWIETHNEYSTGQALAALLRDAACPNLKIIWDIIHPIEEGEAPAQTWSWLGGSIAHVHIKDGICREDPSWHDYLYTPLGDGQLPVQDVLALLRAHNYKGFISFEWESAWRPELAQYPQDLESVLRQWKSYLAGGYLPGFTAPGWYHNIAAKDAHFQAEHFGAGGAIVQPGPAFQFGKWLYDIDTVQAGRAYQFTVQCALKDAASPLAAYALLTFQDKNGAWLSREYTENTSSCPLGLRLDIALTAPAGSSCVTIELGLKGVGSMCWYNPRFTQIPDIPARPVKIAPVYLSMQKHTFTASGNLARIERAVDKAGEKQPDIILLSETINDRGIQRPFAELCETQDGPYCTLLRKKARQYNCYILFTFHETQAGALYNTAMLLGRSGETVGIYRKTHLALVEYERGMTPGTEYPVFETDFGKVGVMICFDCYFPEPARILRQKGAELLLVSTAGDPAVQLMSRAVENGLYVAVAGVNMENSLNILPSKIISPHGEILGHTMDDESFAWAEIDLGKPAASYWLSVGDAVTDPKNLFLKERCPHTYPKE